ncbi:MULTISPECIES: phosphatidylglycerophosphatase A [Acidobacterium]|uniref:Phosphatidylglycerophosphatase A n=1 Tax=Acidobacterium capsulatum (strain ATCC 51196 / DSM 11244 / BCRC 80197 / JCM 7670 / NBRC 15755 / NCIMB 13165 / 161) TaxID=240015 RepID=C1F6H3_ACIC5|nr:MULTISPECIES: phosphatidylglycerophosphatase A [Acidobacterium]ACO34120.1 phosphatidylglycerophosphatase A [Acidobacterium capsulatum ATCC 51196]HCT60764.1 phosphatidylglycerophosphatase A [Acidobacterium sp.]
MTNSAQKPKTLWAWTAATALGVGFGKPGPGTWGSVAAVLIWFAVGAFSHLSRASMAWGTLAAAIIVTLIGIPAATRVEQECGRQDPGFVVLDEVAGQWLTLVACPVEWRHALLGLLLFRLFDIVKPWPVRRLERLPGGTGIMLDDVAAGLLGLVVMQLVLHWW